MLKGDVHMAVAATATRLSTAQRVNMLVSLNANALHCQRVHNFEQVQQKKEA